jgi:hypothetical protein
MPFSRSLLHVAQPLVDLCVAYKPEDDDYIRNVFFPRKDVQHLTDKIRQVSKADTLRLYDLDASGDGEVAEVQYRLGSDLTYDCKILAAKARVTSIDSKNADAALMHEMRQTKQALISVGQRMEYLAVNQTLRSASVLTNNETLTAAERWDNFSSASSTPIEDLQAAIAQVRIKTGKRKAGRIKVAMHEFVLMTLMQHPNVLSRISFNPSGTGAVLTLPILAQMLGLDGADIVVTGAQYTSADQGATDAYNAFLGPDVIVGMVDDGGLDDQALGHEFVFDGLAGEDPFLVRKWREEGVGAVGTDFVGVACACDYKVTNADAGFLFKSVIDVSDTERYASLIS